MKPKLSLSIFLKTNWQWLTATLFVIVLAAINIYTGHPLTMILMGIFCVTVVVIRKPNLVLLLAPLLLLLVFRSQSLNTLGSFREQFTALMDNPADRIANIFTPKSGTEVLPDEALQIQELIDQHKLGDYWLTDGLQEDNEIKEKIIESSWPVLIDSNSPYVFGYSGELTGRFDCKIIGTQQDIELGYCE